MGNNVVRRESTIPAAELDEDERAYLVGSLYAHAYELKQYFINSGKPVIEYGEMQLSYMDLDMSMEGLTLREKQCFFLIYVCGFSSEDATTLISGGAKSINERAKNGAKKLAKRYFADEDKAKRRAKFHSTS